jgi:hypothetical protein
MGILESIKGIVCSSERKELKATQDDLQSAMNELSTYKNQNSVLVDAQELSIKRNIELKDANTELNNQVEGLIRQVKIIKLNPVDLFCIERYPVVKKYYKDKIKIGDVLMPCDLREIFTPNSYLVGKMRDSIQQSEDKLTWYRNIMHKVSLNLTWQSEPFDNYYYPPYTITVKRCDCDDFAFLQMSLEPELGVAFGFFIKDKKKIGHAFSVGIVNNGIHVFDGVNNQSMPYDNQDPQEYLINYIITPNQVYEVDGSTEFGDLLW